MKKIKQYKPLIINSRRWATFNWKMFHTVQEASEIIKETNEILQSIK